MEIKSILFFVIIVVLLIIIYKYIVNDANTLTNLIPATTMQTVEATSLAPSTEAGNTSNYTYSTWFYVDDWNYRYGDPKVIFGRMSAPTVPGDANSRDPCPSVVLGPMENNIIVSLAVYPGAGETPEPGSNYIVHTCSVTNVPIQKWVNLLISVYGRTLDIYMDGKLVRTCLLPGVAMIDSDVPVYITPNGGFSGWTSRFQYWPDATDPQKAWDIYKKGYGASPLSFLGGYTVKVDLMQGNTVESSIQF